MDRKRINPPYGTAQSFYRHRTQHPVQKDGYQTIRSSIIKECQTESLAYMQKGLKQQPNFQFGTPLGVLSKRGVNRVKRGGSWNNNAQNCRSANRSNNNPSNRNNNIGFRLVVSPAHRADGYPPADHRTDSRPLVHQGQKADTMPGLVAQAGWQERRSWHGLLKKGVPS